MRLRTAAVVGLERALAFGHDQKSLVDAKAGCSPAEPRVYGPASTQDKGLDKRKSVKTPHTTSAVENAGAIVRPPSPEATLARPATTHRWPSP